MHITKCCIIVTCWLKLVIFFFRSENVDMDMSPNQEEEDEDDLYCNVCKVQLATDAVSVLWLIL